MVLSYYIYRYPYNIIYRIWKLLGLTIPVVFYCPDLLDWEIFAPIQEYLAEIPIASNNPQVRKVLKERGKVLYRMPVFTDAVIMCRHACHKFPAPEIKKIGMRHGPYHFKRMTRAKNYNLFDLYLMTSQADVEAAEAIGVRTARAVGFPKIDSAFNSRITAEELTIFAQKADLDPAKKTVLFTATWTGSGMSALLKWSDRLEELTGSYNIIVTLHPWIEKRYKESISRLKRVYLIEEEPTLPYILLADFAVGDTSSILAECSALNKPLITFRMDGGKRSLNEIEELLDRISIRIDNFDELVPALEEYATEPSLLEKERARANRIMFGELDGKASLRAAEAILEILPVLQKTPPNVIVDRK